MSLLWFWCKSSLLSVFSIVLLSLEFPVLGAFRVHNPLPRIQWLYVIAQKPDFACHYFHPTMDKNMIFKNLYHPTGERNLVSSAPCLCYLIKCPSLLMTPQSLQFNYFIPIGSISQHTLIKDYASSCTAVTLTSLWRKSWTMHLLQKRRGSGILLVTHFASKAMWRIKTEEKITLSNSQFP